MTPIRPNRARSRTNAEALPAAFTTRNIEGFREPEDPLAADAFDGVALAPTQRTRFDGFIASVASHRHTYAARRRWFRDHRAPLPAVAGGGGDDDETAVSVRDPLYIVADGGGGDDNDDAVGAWRVLCHLAVTCVAGLVTWFSATSVLPRLLPLLLHASGRGPPLQATAGERALLPVRILQTTFCPFSAD